METKMAKEEVQLELTKEEIDMLQELANRNGISVDELVEQILEQYKQQIENPEDELFDVLE
jgi:Ribbon-helix-helix protein, copG family